MLARFFVIGLTLSSLVSAPAFAEETESAHHDQMSARGAAIPLSKLHKKTQLGSAHQIRPAASVAALHRRSALLQPGAKHHRQARGPHLATRDVTKLATSKLATSKLARPGTIDPRSPGWMGRLGIIGMADRAGTPEPSLHWDIVGQPAAAGRFAGVLRVAPARSLIVWPINPAYDMSTLTSAEGKVADPNIEWDDVEGDAVINPPNGDDESESPQPALSPNQYYAGLIEDRMDAPLPKIDVGTVTWNNVAQISTQKTRGPLEVAEVNSAPADISARIFVCCRAAAGAAPSQLVMDVVFASQPKNDKIDGLENPEARQTGDIHGEMLHAEIRAQGTNWFRFLLSTTPGDFDENFKLLISRPWIDIPVRFESGRRAILTFATGRVGADAIYAAVHSTD